MILRRFLVVLVLGAGSAGIALDASAGDEPDGGRWWSHVRVLADDGLEGARDGKPRAPQSSRVCGPGIRTSRA